MKFEQALKAMRRGEICKAPYTCAKFKIAINDATGELNLFELGVHNGQPMWLGTGVCGLDTVRDGWKIVRKKPKAPKLKYKVGDRVIFIDGDVPELCPGGEYHRVPGVIEQIVDTEWPYLVKFADRDYWYGTDEWLEPAPPKPLRDVFKDPQAGDVVALADDQRFQWIVVGVDSDSVTYWSVKGGGKLKESRSMWASAPEQYVVLHRAGEEVGSPDATV